MLRKQCSIVVTKSFPAELESVIKPNRECGSLWVIVLRSRAGIPSEKSVQLHRSRVGKNSTHLINNPLNLDFYAQAPLAIKGWTTVDRPIQQKRNRQIIIDKNVIKTSKAQRKVLHLMIARYFFKSQTWSFEKSMLFDTVIHAIV